MNGNKILLIGIVVFYSCQLVCQAQVQALRFLIPTGGRAVLKGASRATISTATMGSELALTQSVQAGIISRSTMSHDRIQIRNSSGQTIGVSIPRNEIDPETTKLMLSNLGYYNLLEFQNDLDLPKTGRMDELTLQALQFAMDEINNRVLTTDSYFLDNDLRVRTFKELKDENSRYVTEYMLALQKDSERRVASRRLSLFNTLTSSEKYLIRFRVKKLLRKQEETVKAPPRIVDVDVTEAFKEFPLNNEQVTSIQKFMNIRGYYDDRIDGIWGPKTEKAARRFYSETPGTQFSLSRFTERIEHQRENALVQLFFVGFGPPVFPRNKHSLTREHIKNYQEFKGLSVTGVLNEATLETLNQEAQIVVELMRLTISNKYFIRYVEEHVKFRNSPSPIVASQKDGDKTYFSIKNTTFSTPKSEFWLCDRAGIPKRLTETEAYAKVISTAAESFKKFAGTYHFLTMLPDKLQKKVILVLDDRRIEIDESHFELNAEEGFNQLRELFPQHDKPKKPRYIVRYSIFDKYLQSQEKGELPSITNFRFSNEDLYDYLNAHFGDSYDFFLADDLNIAVKNLNTLPAIQKQADLKIAYSTGAFEDHKIVHTLLDNHDPSFFVSGLVAIPNTNVILVTGHKDKNLLDFIRNHGRIGNLRNKVLAVFSCFDKADANFYSELIKAYGVKQVIYFPIEIRSSYTELVLNKLLELVQQRTKKNDDKFQMADVIREALKELKLNPEPGTDLNEIQKLLKLRSKVSQNKKSTQKTYVG